MSYRNKTYIAGDWDHDKDAIEKIYEWKESNKLSLDFYDAHEMKQARDTSLPCSIKRSLKDRMDNSKIFVLIVGDQTNSVTKGSCQFCDSYSTSSGCRKGYFSDTRSFIKYECDKAVEAEIDIVVLYKSNVVNKDKCPSAVKNIGTHVAMMYRDSAEKYQWNYTAVKDALLMK